MRALRLLLCWAVCSLASSSFAKPPANPVPPQKGKQVKADADTKASKGKGASDVEDDADEVSAEATESESITIIGTKAKVARIAGSAHKVGAETLERQEYDDVHRILKQVPGVYVREEDGFGLRPNIGLRGANSDRSKKVTLLEDGVLMAPAPYSAPAAYYFPLSTRLVGLEVFKGPAAIKHGPNTIGGAVNTISRSVPTQGHVGAIDLGAGMRRTQKVHGYYGYGTRYYGVLLEAASLKSEGFKELDGGGDTGFDKYEFMVKFRLNNNPDAEIHHRLDLKFGYSDERSHETYLGLTDDDFQKTPYRRYAASQMGLMEWGRYQTKLTYTTFIGNNLETRLTAYRNDFERAWRKLNRFANTNTTIADILNNPDPMATFIPTLRGEYTWEGGDDPQLAIGINQRTYVSQGVQLKVDWKAGRGNLKNHLQVGARFHMDEIKRNHTEAPYIMQEGRVSRLNSSKTIVLNSGEANAIAAYLFDELKLFKRLHLTPGARIEIINTRFDNRTPTLTGGAATIDENDSMVILPGGGIWYSLSNHWGVLAGVHQGFSPQAPQNQSFDAEKSLNYEFGTRWKYKPIKGELIGYLNDYTNLTGTCSMSAGCDPEDIDAQFNAGEAYVYGAEFNINTDNHIGAGVRLAVDLSYTLTLSEFRTDFKSKFAQWGDVKEGYELPYIPKHQGALTIGFRSETWSLDVTTTHVSDMRDIAGTGSIPDKELIAAHTIVDANAFYHVSQHGRIYITGDNLLARKYMVSRRPFGARPGKPLQINLGYKHQF